ncbi:MAG: hypothetical protein HQ522_01590 [Bacteroidetes bacterium]|nr:hypothetical protein [Bacteroidota bacterium]
MKKIFFISFLLLSLISNSQNFDYQIRFEGIGDNREYSPEYAMPQTILGTRGAFELGVEMDGHRLRGGLSELYEFGSAINFHQPKLTMYYQFKDEQTEFVFGAFPRSGKINFPLAMLTDTLLYYRPNIEGFFGEVNWDWGHQNGFVDWVSRQTETERENFMAGFSGEIGYKNIFIQNYLLLFHDAHTSLDIPGDHIKDYMGFALQAGIRTSKESVLQGSVKAGILESSYRERGGVTDGFINAVSFFAEANGKYKNFGIKSVLNSGAGHRFAYGDLFYRVKNYWRTDAIWYFINHEKVKGTFKLSFHLLDWNDLDQQQQLSIIYVLGK